MIATVYLAQVAVGAFCVFLLFAFAVGVLKHERFLRERRRRRRTGDVELGPSCSHKGRPR